MPHVQVRVNERGALRNGRFAFSNKYTLVSELLQNARRAGATAVRIEYDRDGKSLTVTDDGCGIEDFQTLVTFNESGWDDAIAAGEHAFGIGFSKVLYSADRVTVTSRGRRLAFHTREALDQALLRIEDDPTAIGGVTTVHLAGVDIRDLDERIDRIVGGFPLPVTFNGKVLPRPFAVDALPFTDTAIGKVHLHGFRSGERAYGTVQFLQGFLVHAPTYWYGQPDVVHLDSREFVARLPDRTELIDAEEQSKRVDQAMKALWRAVLMRRKSELSAAEFIDRYFELAQWVGHLDLFDDVPLLPRQVCQQIVAYPIQDGGDECHYVHELAHHLPMADIERGDVLLAELDAADGTNFAYWMYARARGYVLVRGERLSENHWVHRHVRHLLELPVELERLGESHRTTFEGRVIGPSVVLCERFAIGIGADRVEIEDEALFHDGEVIVPLGDLRGEVVRQVSSYIDESERFREDDYEADRHALSQLIRRLRSIDPIHTLRSLLSELSLESYPLLAGKTFRLGIGTARDRHFIDLVS